MHGSQRWLFEKVMAQIREAYEGNIINVESVEDLKEVTIHRAVFPRSWETGYTDIGTLLSQLLQSYTDKENIPNKMDIESIINQGHGNYVPTDGTNIDFLNKDFYYHIIVNHPAKAVDIVPMVRKFKKRSP